MVNIVLLAKVLGTSYAIAKELKPIVDHIQNERLKSSGNRKVRKGRKYERKQKTNSNRNRQYRNRR